MRTVLGINSGTRYLGLAVLRGTELRAWEIKVVKGRTLQEKILTINSIIYKTLEAFHPQVIALKRVHPARSSVRLNRIVGAIEDIARNNHVKTYEFSIEELKRALLKRNRTRRLDLAEHITSFYPFLRHNLGKEKGRKISYYTRMFEAVALANVATREASYK